jgi:hypothetical protein
MFHFSPGKCLCLFQCEEHDSLRATEQMCSEQGLLGSAPGQPFWEEAFESKLGKQEESQAYGKSENISVL